MQINFAKPLVVMDTETGGLNPSEEVSWSIMRDNIKLGQQVSGKITRLSVPVLEIGAVLLDPTTMEEVDSFHSLCGPNENESFDTYMGRCTPQALEKNGFFERLDELRDAPPINTALFNFHQWLPRKTPSAKKPDFIPVGQKIRFDIEMLNANFANSDMSYQIISNPIDLITFSQVYFALPHTPVVPNYKLTTVASALDISTVGAHTALADVRMTAECFRIYLRCFLNK